LRLPGLTLTTTESFMRRKATVRTRVLGNCDLEFGNSSRLEPRTAVLTSRAALPVADGIRWRPDPTTSRCRMPAVAARHPAAGIH
jgi:hypothetical protein